MEVDYGYNEGDDWPYAWRCGECASLYEATGSAHWWLVNRHAKQDHLMAAKECVDGIIDTRTQEIVLEGCGTAVYQKACRDGYIKGFADKETQEKEEETAVDRSVRLEEDRAPTRREMAELRKLELKSQQTGRIVMKDIVIDRAVLLAFYEAQSIWPDLYPDSSEVSLSAFIRDAVMAFGVMADMFTVTSAVQSAFEIMMGGEHTDGRGE